MNTTDKLLKQALFIEYKVNKSLSPNVNRAWGKWLYQDRVKAFYIHIEEYDFTQYGKGFTYSSKCQFNNNTGTFGVELHLDNLANLDDVELFYLNMWLKMECQYYN